MNTLQDRLAIAMQGSPPVSAADLARACGVRPASVSEWINGPTKSLRGPNAIKAAKCLGVNVEWLSTGNGPMRSGDPPAQVVAPPETARAYVRFPLLDGFAGMGRGDYMGDYPEIVDFVEVTREWATQKLRGVPLDSVRVITGRGDSNKGLYDDGDLLFVDARIKKFEADATYCYRWGGRVQIKRLQWIGDGRVRIISANKAYAPLDVSLNDLEIGARVITGWTLINL